MTSFVALREKSGPMCHVNVSTHRHEKRERSPYQKQTGRIELRGKLEDHFQAGCQFGLPWSPGC
jgi:hypothetical protein